jgi:hypothetical protein
MKDNDAIFPFPNELLLRLNKELFTLLLELPKSAKVNRPSLNSINEQQSEMLMIELISQIRDL